MARVAESEAPAGQDPDSGGDHAPYHHRRAPSGHRRSHRTVREDRGTGKCDRGGGLRLRAGRSPAARASVGDVGKVRGLGRRRKARNSGIVGARGMSTTKIPELFSVNGYGVIVTGGASGLGLGFTEAMANNGARVTMLDIDAGRIAAQTQRLRSSGLDVHGEVVDVCDHAALDRAFDAAAARYGRLDVTFANAG